MQQITRNNDNIIIKMHNLLLTTKVGVFDWEKTFERKILVNFEAEIEQKKCLESDDLLDTVNYDEIYNKIKKIANNSNFNLIEKLAGTMLDEIMADNRIVVASIELQKLELYLDVEYFSVKLTKNRI